MSNISHPQFLCRTQFLIFLYVVLVMQGGPDAAPGPGAYDSHISAFGDQVRKSSNYSYMTCMFLLEFSLRVRLNGTPPINLPLFSVDGSGESQDLERIVRLFPMLVK